MSLEKELNTKIYYFFKNNNLEFKHENLTLVDALDTNSRTLLSDDDYRQRVIDKAKKMNTKEDILSYLLDIKNDFNKIHKVNSYRKMKFIILCLLNALAFCWLLLILFNPMEAFISGDSASINWGLRFFALICSFGMISIINKSFSGLKSDVFEEYAILTLAIGTFAIDFFSKDNNSDEDSEYLASKFSEAFSAFYKK